MLGGHPWHKPRCSIFFEHHHPRCPKLMIKGTMLHPKQPQHHSNVSDYSGQSRTQSQRRMAAASFPREGNTFSFGFLFVFSNQRSIGSLLLRASQRHAASACSPISLVLLLPKIALFICEQPQLEPGVFVWLMPLCLNPSSE